MNLTEELELVTDLVDGWAGVEWAECAGLRTRVKERLKGMFVEDQRETGPQSWARATAR